MPRRIELKESVKAQTPEESDVFQADGVEALCTVTLVWVSQEFYGSLESKMDNETAHRVRDAVGSRMTDLRRQYYDDTRRRGMPKVCDQSIEVPPRRSVNHANFVWQRLGKISWPAFNSRKNATPDKALLTETEMFPMGMVMNYHRGLTRSVTLRTYLNLAQVLTRFLSASLTKVQVHSMRAVTCGSWIKTTPLAP